MKKLIALTCAASTLVLSGCCTTPPAARWEYKVAKAPELPASEIVCHPNQEVEGRLRANNQEFLNKLGKDGWMLVNEDGGTFYLKRPLK